MLAVYARKGILQQVYSGMLGLVIHSVFPEERNAFFPGTAVIKMNSLSSDHFPQMTLVSIEQSVCYRPVTFPGLYSPKGTRNLSHFLLGAPLKLIEDMKSKNSYVWEALSKINADHDSYHLVERGN
jgi:hypothetical protein